MSTRRENVSRRLKKKALELGASVVGIADVERFDKAPEHHKPRDILENAAVVISIGLAQPKAVIESAMPSQYTRSIFTTAAILDQIAAQLSLWIEHIGFHAIPIAARYLAMDALSGVFRGDLSHKHAATLAGLGEIGVNTLLINPRFATRLMLVSIVTNAPLHPDSPLSGSLCLGPKCLKCVNACPVKAINSAGEVDKVKCSEFSRHHSDIYFETWGLYFCRDCRRACHLELQKQTSLVR